MDKVRKSWHGEYLSESCHDLFIPYNLTGNHIMNLNRKISIFAIVFFLIGSSIMSAAQSPEERGQISRLLIIVLVGNAENRQAFEDEIHAQLALKGYGSKQSHDTSLNTGEKITREDVVKVVEENDYDGVLLVKLLDVDRDMSYSTDGNHTTPGVYFNHYAYDYYQQNWDVIKDLQVVIRTDLFFAKDQHLMYTRTSGKLKVDENEEFIDKFTKKLVNKLDKGKYLKKNE